MSLTDLRARFDVPQGHPMFPGHFPDMPVAPGAWLLGRAMEALETSAGHALEWGELESGKFHRAVVPGSTLEVGLEGLPGGAGHPPEVTDVVAPAAAQPARLVISQDGVAIATAKFRSVRLPLQGR